MKLPFLEEKSWPISKEPEERVVNPSYDTQLQDHILDEILLALEKRDATRMREALIALVHSIRNEATDEHG